MIDELILLGGIIINLSNDVASGYPVIQDYFLPVDFKIIYKNDFIPNIPTMSSISPPLSTIAGISSTHAPVASDNGTSSSTWNGWSLYLTICLLSASIAGAGGFVFGRVLFALYC